jgi:hypothetical protein
MQLDKTALLGKHLNYDRWLTVMEESNVVKSGSEWVSEGERLGFVNDG